MTVSGDRLTGERAEILFADALVSNGPSPELGSSSEDFDWIVGGWAAEVSDFDPDGTVRKSNGEWWFAWVLEGRAIQDVWIVPPRQERDRPRRHQAANDRYGSSLRYYDRDKSVWRTIWFNPVSGAETYLTGRRQGNRITLHGMQEDREIRWSFTEITDDSFVWIGESRDPGGSWILEAEFRMRRMSSAGG